MSSSDFGRLQRRAGVAGGSACFEGTGILVSVVAGRFAGGESIAELAQDYDLPIQTVEAGLRLVLVVNGTRLTSRRAAAKVAEYLPLLRRR